MTFVPGSSTAFGGQYANPVVESATVLGLSGATDIRFYQNSTEGMRLTSTGLGIGTSSPTSKLTVVGEINVVDNYALRLGSNQAGGATILYNGNGNLDITPRSTFSTVFTAGNVGIGTNSPEAKLHIGGNNGIRFGDAGATPKADITYTSAGAEFLDIKIQGTTSGFGNIRFSTGGTPSEAARIDSSGNLLVGTTSTGQGTKLVVKGAGDIWSYGPDNSGGTTFYVINNSGVGVGLSTGNTSWSAISDERLKNIKEPITNAVEKLSTLRSVYGNYKTDSDDVSRLFLIAQDVQKVFPEVIDTAEDELKTLSLRSTDLIPVLVKAMQEQQAMIESLRQRLSAANL
jgi:hypothetical protein